MFAFLNDDDSSAFAKDYDNSSHEDIPAFERNKKEAAALMKRLKDGKLSGLKTVLICPESNEAVTQMAQFMINLQRKRTPKPTIMAKQTATAAPLTSQAILDGEKAAAASVTDKDKEVDESAGLGEYTKPDESIKTASESSISSSSSPAALASPPKFESDHAISALDQTQTQTQNLFFASPEQAAAARLAPLAKPSKLHMAYFDPRDVQYGGRMSRRVVASKYYGSIPIHSMMATDRVDSYLYFRSNDMIYRYRQLLQSQVNLRVNTKSNTNSQKIKDNAYLVAPVFVVLLPSQLALDHQQLVTRENPLIAWESNRFYHEVQRNTIDQKNAEIDAAERLEREEKEKQEVAAAVVSKAARAAPAASPKKKKISWWNSVFSKSKSSVKPADDLSLASSSSSFNSKKLKARPQRQTPKAAFNDPVPEWIETVPVKSMDQYEQQLRDEFHLHWMEIIHDKVNETSNPYVFLSKKPAANNNKAKVKVKAKKMVDNGQQLEDVDEDESSGPVDPEAERLESEAAKNEYKLVFVRAEDWMPKDDISISRLNVMKEMIQERAALANTFHQCWIAMSQVPITMNTYHPRDQIPELAAYDRIRRNIQDLDRRIRSTAEHMKSLDFSSPILLNAMEDMLQWINQRLELPLPVLQSTHYPVWDRFENETDFEWIEETEIENAHAQTKQVDDTDQSTNDGKKLSIGSRITKWFKGAAGSEKASKITVKSL